jgi:hypothetical protein
VQGNPAAMAELNRLGVAQVPAVAVGDRAVHGWNPSGYAELLGIAYTPPVQFAPLELASRLDRILESAEALLSVLDQRQVDWEPPERPRNLRDLGYHVFRLSLAYVDGMDLGRFPHSWLQETAPEDLRDGAAIARYGALVRARLSGWFDGAGGDEYARIIDVYYGPQSGHDLLERTTWHAGQHLRQLYDLAGRLHVTPPKPLPAEALKGLPLPDAVW